jgi:hypothetical protein
MANFNNPYFPSYNPYQQFQTMQQPQQQNSGGLLWVQGIEGAKSHFVEPGRSALLMDSESNSFFIKSADTSGMPLPLRLFDYKERTQSAPQSPVTPVTDTSVFITRDEFESRLAAITAATERIESDAE